MTFNQHRAVKPSEACFLTCVLLTVKLWEVAPATLSVFMQLVFTQFRWIPAVTRIHGGEKKNCQNIIRNVSKHSCCKDSASPKSICSRSMFLFLAVLLPIVLPELRMTGGWWCNMLVKLRAALSVQINTPKEDYGTKVVEDVVWVWGRLYFFKPAAIIHSSIIHPHPCLWSLQSQPDERASERRAFVLDMEGRVLTSHSFSSDLCTWGTNTRCQDVFPGWSIVSPALDFCHIFDSASSNTKINGGTSRG